MQWTKFRAQFHLKILLEHPDATKKNAFSLFTIDVSLNTSFLLFIIYCSVLGFRVLRSEGEMGFQS